MQSITLNIEDADYAKLIDGVFYNSPVPLIPVLDDDGIATFDNDGNPILEPQYTDLEWIKVLVMDNLSVLYCRGIKSRDGNVGREKIDRELIRSIKASNLE